VFEVLYITKGKVGVGYRLFNEIFLGMALHPRAVVNDYAMVSNHTSEFIYQPIIDDVHGMIIRKSNFQMLLKDIFWQKLAATWTKKYILKVRNKVIPHRQ
tara:strand:+ start:1796 stop:2095 length:300 start_codon:yes stop_codon:yes gene_type:complete